MNRLAVVGLTAVVLLLGDLGTASAQRDFWDDKAPGGSGGLTSSGPVGPGGLASAAPPSGTEAPKKSKTKRRSRARAQAKTEVQDEESGRHVWTETDTTRIKSVYDEAGNLVYQKAWDKKSGDEVVPPELVQGTGPEAAKLDTATPPGDAKGSARPRKTEDGEYDLNRTDPRPAHATHKLHAYPPKAERHPYEFSLHVSFWNQDLSGEIKGAGGVKGTLTKDNRTTMQGEFHNAKMGYSYTELRHASATTTVAVFNGVTYRPGAIFDENLKIFDGFYRWPFWTSRDSWIDWLLGLKIIGIKAKVLQDPVSTTVSSTAPLPELGLIGQTAILDNIRIRGFIKGGYGALETAQGMSLDLELEVSYTFPGENEYNVLSQFSAGVKSLYLDFVTKKEKADESGAAINHLGPYIKYSAYF